MALCWQQTVTGVSSTFNELVQYRKCFVLITCSATQAEADKSSFLSTLRKQSVRVIATSLVFRGSGSEEGGAVTRTTHTHTPHNKPHHCTWKVRPNWNVSDPAKWMAVGLETSVQLCHGLSLGENPLAAADCALEHNPNTGVFTLNVYRHPSYELRFISGVRWILCAQRPGQGRVFSEAIFKWSNSSWGLSRPSCQWRQTQTSLIDLR